MYFFGMYFLLFLICTLFISVASFHTHRVSGGASKHRKTQKFRSQTMAEKYPRVGYQPEYFPKLGHLLSDCNVQLEKTHESCIGESDAPRCYVQTWQWGRIVPSYDNDTPSYQYQDSLCHMNIAELNRKCFRINKSLKKDYPGFEHYFREYTTFEKVVGYSLKSIIYYLL